MLAELSKIMAILFGRTEKTGSPKASINSVKRSSCRKNIGGKRSLPQGRPLDRELISVKSSKLEKITRRGFLRIK